MIKKIIYFIGVTFLVTIPVTTIHASDLTFGFKNPSFHSGNGYSSHVLSVEQLRYTRKQEQAKEEAAAAAEAEREAARDRDRLLEEQGEDANDSVSRIEMIKRHVEN